MFKGETVLSGAMHPNTDFKVLESPAGFYLGFKSATGEPYTRETDYFGTRDSAQQVLDMFRS